MILEQYKSTGSFMSTFQNGENMEKVGIMCTCLQQGWVPFLHLQQSDKNLGC